MRNRGLSRRELLELIAIVAIAPGCKSDRTPAPTTGSAGSAGSTPKPPATALDAASYRTLDAVTGRILPADGTFPGAREAKVIDFIDRQLTIQPLSRVAPALITLARTLDDIARTKRAPDFAQLSAGDQDAMLEALSRGTLGTKLPERELFKILHGFVLEGYLADPHHGGNHDQIAWKAIGFPEPSLRTPGGHGHHR